LEREDLVYEYIYRLEWGNGRRAEETMEFIPSERRQAIKGANE